MDLEYLIPRNCGFSPGAEHSDTLVSDLTWLIESTVAATNLELKKKDLQHQITEEPTSISLSWCGSIQLNVC